MTEHEFTAIIKATKKVVLSAVEKHLAARFHHAIDDVVQETYLRAYRGLVKRQFRGESLVSTWLYEIAKNECYRMNRKLMREEEKARRASGALVDAGAAYAFEEPGGRDTRAADLEKLRKTIARLPVKYRGVLELVSLGHTEKEIASRLDIRSGTVKSRLSRGRELLARVWEGGED
jgi:RNA polymerase sigma-70 factor (ECF subfamily)